MRAVLDIPSADRQAIERWLERGVALMDRDNVDGASHSDTNNSRYSRDAVNMAWGVVIGDEARFRAGVERYRQALRQMRADGSFPQETARGPRALTYQNLAVSILISMAEMASRRGLNLYAESFEGRTIHQAVGFLLAAERDDAALKVYADAPQRSCALETISIGPKFTWRAFPVMKTPMASRSSKALLFSNRRGQRFRRRQSFLRLRRTGNPRGFGRWTAERNSRHSSQGCAASDSLSPLFGLRFQLSQIFRSPSIAELPAAFQPLFRPRRVQRDDIAGHVKFAQAGCRRGGPVSRLTLERLDGAFGPKGDFTVFGGAIGPVLQLARVGDLGLRIAVFGGALQMIKRAFRIPLVAQAPVHQHGQLHMAFRITFLQRSPEPGDRGLVIADIGLGLVKPSDLVGRHAAFVELETIGLFQPIKSRAGVFANAPAPAIGATQMIHAMGVSTFGENQKDGVGRLEIPGLEKFFGPRDPLVRRRLESQGLRREKE